MMKTQNVSSEDARNMKKSVIFFCDKKIWLKRAKKCASISERIIFKMAQRYLLNG